MKKEDIEFYERNFSMCLKQFFHDGNIDLQMHIYPHNCQTGLWFHFHWKKKDQIHGGCSVGGSTLIIARRRLIEWQLKEEEKRNYRAPLEVVK